MNLLRKKLLPYAQLARCHRPSPSLLLFLPGSWSISASTYALDFPISDAVHTTALFAAGAFLMRGAGCTINDLWDKDLDKHVTVFYCNLIFLGRKNTV
jgi:4-hydroxybenzoate polyprenyltransferase